MTKQSETSSFECTASKESPSCSTCNILAQLVIEGAMDPLMTPNSIGVLTEAVAKQVETVVNTNFPANMIDDGSGLSCANRRQVVRKLAVDLTRARQE